MDASPSLNRLDFFADFGLIMGSFALIIGLVLAFTPVGILPMIGTAVAVLGGIVLLGGLTSRSVALGVRALTEASAAAGQAPTRTDAD